MTFTYISVSGAPLLQPILPECDFFASYMQLDINVFLHYAGNTVRVPAIYLEESEAQSLTGKGFLGHSGTYRPACAISAVGLGRSELEISGASREAVLGGGEANTSY